MTVDKQVVNRLYDRIVNARASYSGDLHFKYWTGQILHSVANGFATASTSMKAAVLRYVAEMGIANS